MAIARFRFFAVPVAALLLFGTTTASDVVETEKSPKAASDPATLSPADQEFLDRLVKEFIFDPKGAQFVALKAKTWDVLGDPATIDRQGWRVAGKGKGPDRVYFVDGFHIDLPAGKKVEKLDFVALCRKCNAPTKAESARDSSSQPREDPGEFSSFPDLVKAAWLHRLGDDGLAAAALAYVRAQCSDSTNTGEDQSQSNDAKLVASVQKQFANNGIGRMMHSFGVRADDDALAEASRLVRLYPDQAKELVMPSAVIADLQRRRANGTFGKSPAKEWPQGFASWYAAKKIAYLIESLDELDAPFGQWTGSDESASTAEKDDTDDDNGEFLGLLRDRRVGALLQLGDAAIPALIETIQNDTRLTRFRYLSDENEVRPMILSVRQAALVTAMAIVRVPLFNSDEKDPGLTLKGAKQMSLDVDRLRAYWKTYGAVPFDDRMMKMLANPDCGHEQCRNAAFNLANPTIRRLELAHDDNIGVTTIRISRCAAEPGNRQIQESNRRRGNLGRDGPRSGTA